MWLKKSITEAHWELNHWNEKKNFFSEYGPTCTHIMVIHLKIITELVIGGHNK